MGDIEQTFETTKLWKTYGEDPFRQIVSNPLKGTIKGSVFKIFCKQSNCDMQMISGA